MYFMNYFVSFLHDFLATEKTHHAVHQSNLFKIRKKISNANIVYRFIFLNLLHDIVSNLQMYRFICVVPKLGICPILQFSSQKYSNQLE